MRFAAVQRTFLRTAPAVGASNAVIGAWVRLYGYAVEIENGGAIPDAASHDERSWLTLAGVTVAEIADAVDAGLCEWRDHDLVVLGYDLDGEAAVRTRRENGKLGGRPPRKPVGTTEPDGKPGENRLVNRAGTGRQTGSKPLSSPLPSSPLPSSPLHEEDQIAESREPAQTPASPAPPSPALLMFQIKPGKRGASTEWAFTQADLRKLAEAFPGLDVLAEAKKARLWCEAEAARRKTASGMLSFLRRWMSKAHGDRQGRGVDGRANHNPAVGHAQPSKFTQTGEIDL